MDDEDEGETELFTRDALARMLEEEAGFELDDTGPTDDAPPRGDPVTVPLRDFFSPHGDESQEDPPTVVGPPTALLRDTTGRSDEGLPPRPLPIRTSQTPKGIDSWPAPLDQEDTWPARRMRRLVNDDRTAPTLFPTPEDSGKEQRPYPPAKTPPPAPTEREVPAAITSSLVGLAVAMLLVAFLVVSLLVWMSTTGQRISF